MLRYAFTLTGRRVVAEEIVQEVFMQLHARWHEVQTPSAWLIRCVRNRAFQYLRKSKREVLTAGEEARQNVTTQEPTPDSLMAHMETCAVLRGLVDGLEETDRQLVKLKYFEGLKYRDISQKTGLSITNVGYRLHHILKLLGQKLQPPEIDDES